MASRVRPVRELKGFEKVGLAPGESTNVTFTLTRRDLMFAVGDPHMASVSGNTSIVEPGTFGVWVAASAAEGDASSFELSAPSCGV